MKRDRKEKRELGRLMSLAFNDPSRIDEEFKDPPVEAVKPSMMETARWW